MTKPKFDNKGGPLFDIKLELPTEEMTLEDGTNKLDGKLDIFEPKLEIEETGDDCEAISFIKFEISGLLHKFVFCNKL